MFAIWRAMHEMMTGKDCFKGMTATEMWRQYHKEKEERS